MQKNRQINKFRLLVISIAKFNLNKNKYQALFADHQADGRGPPVVRGPQVENRCSIIYNSRLMNTVNDLANLTTFDILSERGGGTPSVRTMETSP